MNIRNRRNRKRNYRPRKSRSSALTFYTINPFEGVDPEVVKITLAGMGARKAEVFRELISELYALFRERDSLHILSVIAGYGLQVPVSDSGVSDKKILSQINQHHVELLQAIMLSIPIEEFGTEFANPENIQRTIDIITDISESFHQQRFASLIDDIDLEARTILFLQERIRLHTQVVRNWGYFSDVVNVSTELYETLNKKFNEVLKFQATDIIIIFKCIVSIIEDRLSARMRRLSRVFREQNISKMIKIYYKNNPNLIDSADDFISSMPAGVSREWVVSAVLSHTDLELLNLFKIIPEDLKEMTNLDREQISIVLDAMSLSLGSLSNEKPEHFFMANPIWISPIISFNKEYYCIVPQTALSHIHEVMRFFAEKAKIKTELDLRRSSYLEGKVASLFKGALPEAKIVHNVKWSIDNVEYETDHVCALDRTVLIIEDKSHSLTASGLRGAPDRVKRHVRELIAEPSEQSLRLEDIIRRSRDGNREASESLMPFGIEFSQMDRIIRISVTLEDFSVLSSSERELKAAGWIDNGVELSVNVGLADLICIFDVLDRPSFIFHYFAERFRIQKEIDIIADELDFLGVYLETGFNLYKIEKEQIRLSLTGGSELLDSYYCSRDAGIKLPKPKPNLTAHFRNVIETIEARAFSGWLSVTTDLLRCLDFQEQQELDRILLKLKANVTKNWRDPMHECSIMITPTENRDMILIFYVYREKAHDSRRENAEKIVDIAMKETGRKRYMIFGKCIEKWQYPYTFLYLADLIDENNTR